MNIVNALTLRHMKLNKKRTIVTIIGVIISVCMITAVATLVASFLNMMQKAVIQDRGNWHVRYNNVPVEYINNVIKDKNVSSAAISRDIGYAILEGSKNKDKPYLFIQSLNTQGFTNFNLNLIEGRFPVNSGEILMSSHTAENGGVEYKVGDVIRLEIGGRRMDDDELNALGQDISFRPVIDNQPGERFTAEFSREYTVTGIISRPNFEPYWAPGYTAVTYLDMNELDTNTTVSISAALKHVPMNLFKQTDKFAEKAGIANEDISYNHALLRYHLALSDDNLLATFYTLASVVILLIILGSVSLIYNAFAISISERSRYLGMLASVGATKKQKRNSVFFEGFVVGIIGIPIGVILGTIGIGVTFIFVQPLIEGMGSHELELTLVTSPLTILAAVVLSIATIFISAYIPAKRASRISPMDAIRQAKDIKLTGKTVKTSKLTRSIFGFEAELALKNLKRNKRRYKTTIFSLVLSIVLFLSVSAVSLFSRKSADVAADSIPYDVNVIVTSSATDQEKVEFYSAIAKLDYADESVIERFIHTRIKARSSLVPENVKLAIDPGYKQNGIDMFDINVEIISVDDDTLERYTKESGADIGLLKDTMNPSGILVNALDIKTDSKYVRTDYLNIDEGDKLEFIHSADFSSKFEIAAITDKTPIGDTSLRYPANLIFVVSNEVFNSLETQLPDQYVSSYPVILIKSSDPAKLVENIYEYQKKTSIANISVYDVTKTNRTERQFETFVYVFFYGFLTLITAICAANILNTISTSISLRKREFGMLRSIGMTPEGFGKMINYESIFYGIKALLYGLPISFAIIYYLFAKFRNSFEFRFMIPWGSVLAAVIGVFAIVGCAMMYASSKIKKENIMDVLKEENI